MRERVTRQSHLASDINVTKDSGVTKNVVVRGSKNYRDSKGNNNPPAGAEVKVHFTGRLPNGMIFDASRDNKAYSFILGKRNVILGWDCAVATMQKGEVCNVSISPEYGYGTRWMTDIIPPNSTLLFEIRLVSWSLPGDLTREERKGREQFIWVCIVLLFCAAVIPLMEYVNISH